MKKTRSFEIFRVFKLFQCRLRPVQLVQHYRPLGSLTSCPPCCLSAHSICKIVCLRGVKYLKDVEKTVKLRCSMTSQAWATSSKPRPCEPSEDLRVSLDFKARGLLSQVSWCPLTGTWHCPIGQELLILLKESDSSSGSCGSCGSYELILSSEPEESLSLQRDLTAAWTAKFCGQTDCHVRFIDRDKRRLFAKVATLCIHPLWHEADPSSCQIRNVQVELDVMGWLVRCALQLSHGCVLRCPSTIGSVEARLHTSATSRSHIACHPSTFVCVVSGSSSSSFIALFESWRPPGRASEVLGQTWAVGRPLCWALDLS